MPDAFLDADEIRAATCVRHVEIHDTLGSTNDRASELARSLDIELPALIVARHQTSGRGRGDHTWWSDDGALTFSVLIEPASLGISTANWPQLSLATAVAVCDALAIELNTHSPLATPNSPLPIPQSPHLAIKWPNDIMLDDRKVCGILIEAPGGPAPAKDRLVIGIGINVNNSWRDAPRELSSRATSLRDRSEKLHSLHQVLSQVLIEFQRNLIKLGRHDPQLPLAWQRLCWLSNRRVSAEDGRQVIEGICAGIAGDGALLIQTQEATTSIYGGSPTILE